MDEQIEDLSEEKPYDLDIIGNFGRFTSSNSYPIEFIQGSMPISQAQLYLKFAREFEMEELDFELLMQRDIDDDRVDKEIIPYLSRDQSAARNNPIFFPPLLVAIVPVVDEGIQTFYGPDRPIEPRPGYAGRCWEGNFEVYGRSTKGTEGVHLVPGDDDTKIKARQAVMSIRTEQANGDGVALIVIDGQHRLMALKRVYKNNRSAVKDLIVPICILFAPESNSRNKENPKTQAVPRVFRSLFVDVNTTMKTVGGHFNILLSDSSIFDLTCRAFCDYVLDEYGKKGLALVEWNTRSAKQSYNVNRDYTSTSIGIVQRALKDNFKPERLINYLYCLDEEAKDVFPESADPEDYFPKIKWDQFSYAQSLALYQRARNKVAPLLAKIFIDSQPFSSLRDGLYLQVADLESERDELGPRGTSAKAVLRKVLDYKPLDDDVAFERRFEKFEAAVQQHRKSRGLDVLRYALFQRGVMNVALEMAKLGMEYDLSPEGAFDLASTLLEAVFADGSSVLAPEQPYMQHTAFQQRRIRTREDTRIAFRDVLLAHLLNDSVRKRVIAVLPEEVDKAGLESAVKEIGFNAAGDFLMKYRAERRVAFRKSYDLDYSLSQEQREQLKLLEIAQKTQEKRVKDQELDESAVEKVFDDAVEEYVSDYVAEAKDAFVLALGLKVGLLEATAAEVDDDDLDSEESSE